MVRMVSLNPARATGIDHEVGSIEVGKKADLLLVKEMDGLPVITHVFVDGKLVLQTHYRL